jgi:hypothetical protein
MSAQVTERWLPRNYPTPRQVPFCTAEQFVAAALKAYYAAAKLILPDKGEYWMEHVEGVGYVVWAGPEDFHNHLIREIDARARELAIVRGDLERIVEPQVAG